MPARGARGLTGWAQINGLRGDTDLGKRIEAIFITWKTGVCRWISTASLQRSLSERTHTNPCWFCATVPYAYVLLCSACYALPQSRMGPLESNEWAVTGTLDGAIGYDSNLTTSHDGLMIFCRGEALSDILRRNSSTDFRINAA